ncbi:MAG: LPP20 family lipoprotein [Bacteroidota bacterium]
MKLNFKIKYLLFFLFLTLTVIDYAQSLPEEVAPGWVRRRPVNNSKFIGIGVAEKKPGNNYQSEAKKNALFDLSSEIKVDISTNSILYTVQNNNQFNENFNSLIKLSSSDNIEGYKLVDTYENDKQYWLYYELDKAEYENLKLQRKQQTIARALNMINLSFDDEKNGIFTGSLKKRIQAFGILSPYLNEEVNFESSNHVKNIFELSNLIQKQIQSISIVDTKTISIVKPYQPSYKPLIFKFVIKGKNPLVDFPFKLNSDNENVKIKQTASTNQLGELEINIVKVKPLNQEIYFTLNPFFKSIFLLFELVLIYVPMYMRDFLELL